MRILGLVFLLVFSCSQTPLKTESRKSCQNYNPSCEMIGAEKQCSYNSDGCQTCNCVPKPGTHGYDPKNWPPGQ